ncbi:glutamate dehydrogenase [Mycolicibacterium conceptionense]|uniref:Glutamate dehydrogenase n=1 Tax=Mycolicibacterium conceptionense TaxID=451644 RepID=A0A1A1Z0H5_9MYCO|nr:MULTISPECIES: NAD-glutamate dehydrogenase domain-containing protein [Mycolicibacterium]MCW1821131.1 NAD-glutamate dehydrogenase [Mycolicibacterium senegalense]OBB08093.1 glutamate dehydrogenase [Mycolicibacterium conceptionense]OBE95599.1 glutamate dehydrogenase [Mycolicibacterium conceptionense]OBF28625.1 glutamate dehydrogenase [Mycolicibacterium conceptionense]OBF37061.1 glutamate dehydrogenase [Mycolicibacterium conceptionense]
MESPSARVHFTVNEAGARAEVRWPGPPPLLAEVCAMFEHFGLRVASYQLTDTGHHYEFGTLALPRPTLELIARAFEAATAGHWQTDHYAALIPSAGIDWRQAVLIRAASRFTRQTGLGFSPDYIADSLVTAPDFVNALLALFDARFNPAGHTDADQAERADQEVAALVEAATSLDDERIRRALHSFVRAVLRTNWFQTGPDGRPKDYLSFKIDSSRLADVGPVVPYREIYVYSDIVEGIHLRSGPIARGGLRWSSRPEDFRTEVLGLMKTQAVKNAPIVPAGAKGAFVLRNPDAAAADGYRTFIRGMLDITDNIVDGAVRHPDRTVCPDGPDAYLVVAADKGTATFSDLANAIAGEYGFWLGDAFASGGSAGYDHKAMGITARGAWLSVRRHFAEAGHDIDTQPFTVAGIGDMSGDVFGNGMLLSDNIKLVAAFDHRHIFVDPDPDRRASFDERARMFALHSSSWQDYDSRLISTGGGVWSRTAKSIPLSPQARAVLGIEAAEATPDQLISAVLCAPVDLLWNGGVGTYVRADEESDADARDKANDRVRVTASQLRCKVIGEGGNLGLTQQARIAFALSGGRINADFIDNAAGVATSDLEVNIKIALDSGNTVIAQRNTLLATATDEVAARVLADNAEAILAISIAAAEADSLLDRHIRLIGNLQEVAGVDPQVEGLPAQAELVRRRSMGLGLTRPEIAVLLAQSKNLVTQELLASEIPDDEAFSHCLVDYFPAAIAEYARAELSRHPLRREIVATAVAGELINRVGPGTIYRMQERLAVTTAQVARAYATVRDILDLDALWAAELARYSDEGHRIQVLLQVRELIEHLTSWVLRTGTAGHTQVSTAISRLVTAAAPQADAV